MDPQHDRRAVVRCPWHHESRERDMVINSHQLGDHSPLRIRLLSSPLVLRRATAPLPPDEPAPGTAAGAGETGSVARRKLHNPSLRGRFQRRDRPPPPEVGKPLLQPLRRSGGKAARGQPFPPDRRSGCSRAWLPPVAEAGLGIETGHGGGICAACVERRCPSPPTRQRYRVRVRQAAVAPSLDTGPVEKRGSGCGTGCGPPAG